MIEFNLDAADSILYLRPKSALAADDFVKIARAVDPHIEATGHLAGVIVEAPGFPGWDGLGALVAHLRTLGGEVHTGVAVTAIESSGRGVTGVRLDDGERVGGEMGIQNHLI